MSDKELKYKITADGSAFNKAMSDAVNQTGQLDNRMSNISKGGLMSAVSGGNLLAGAIGTAKDAVIDFAKESVMAFRNQEKFLTSLQTMFHGNKTEAELLNNQLKTFATTTPFELTEIQDATKMMIAYGSKSQGVVEEMRMLGDISSGVGSSLSEVAYLYGTLRVQGRAFAKDITQFQARGIDVVGALAKQYGKTKSEIADMVEAGKIGFKEVERAFQSMTKEGGQFFGMMDNQSKTLDGQISNMSDAWGQLQASIGASQEGILKSTTAWVTNMINTINSGFNTIQNLGKRMKAGGGAFDAFNIKDILSGKNLDLAGISNSLNVQMNVAQKSLKDAQNQNILLISQMQQLTKDYGSGKITKDKFESRFALMKGFQVELESLIGIKKRDVADLASSKSGEKKSGGTASSKLGTTAEISGAKPQSIVINITKLVESLNLSTTNLTESASKIKEEVAKALLEAVNDVNTLARTA